jgi:hypothetical protein
VRARPLAVLACLLLAGGATACGSKDSGEGPQPQVGVKGDEPEAAQDLGFPAFATKNTTRVGGADPVANAAGVARAIFPSTEDRARPKAVALVDKDDWRGGVAAAALNARPLRAPVLLTDGDDLPAATQTALDALSPTGSEQAGDAQVIRVGDVAEPDGLKDTEVDGDSPAEVAAQIDGLLAAAKGRSSDRVVVVADDQPEYAMPAAGWAAKSGDPVLYVERDAVPAATRAALKRHQQPKIYILGPRKIVSDKVEEELKRLGTVTRISAGDPVRSAILFARFVDGSFGWGVIDAGHGVVFVNQKRTLDAVAAAPLSGNGTYGPIVLHDGADQLPKPLETFLLNIQPGYRRDPVRGVYNHGWVIGDEKALPIATQARIDALLEIVPEELRPPGKTDQDPSS